jgi:hypothetical protein
MDYCRLVDDILIICNTQTNISDVLDEFNTIYPKIKFTMEEESDNKINYLDITILKTHNKLSLGISRKPTATHLIISNDSCHSYEHTKQQ